ncbi:MAG: hypothetical protein HQK84_11080 [Nitrospinae bacterium]|nr:hypothetical protein [Nitrospinota bacterium]
MYQNKVGYYTEEIVCATVVVLTIPLYAPFYFLEKYFLFGDNEQNGEKGHFTYQKVLAGFSKKSLNRKNYLEKITYLEKVQDEVSQEQENILTSLRNKVRNETTLDLLVRLDYDEKRLNFRHTIPSEFSFFAGFSSGDFRVKGKLINISQDGCALEISGIKDEGSHLALPKGTFALIINQQVFNFDHIEVIYLNKNKTVCGFSMDELTKYPDIKLQWLEVCDHILNVIKEK